MRLQPRCGLLPVRCTPPRPRARAGPRGAAAAGRADASRRLRSPYTNTYYDPEDPSAEVEGEEEYDRPSAELRKYEEAANEVFDMYRERYYSGPPAPKASLSSVYFWDPVDSEASMAGCILFHNVAETPGIQGTWDSIHVAEVTEGQGKGDLAGTCHYKLTTTVILQCDTEGEGVKNNVGGYRMQVMEKDMKNDAENTHLVPQTRPPATPGPSPCLNHAGPASTGEHRDHGSGHGEQDAEPDEGPPATAVLLSTRPRALRWVCLLSRRKSTLGRRRRRRNGYVTSTAGRPARPGPCCGKRSWKPRVTSELQNPLSVPTPPGTPPALRHRGRGQGLHAASAQG